MKIRYTETALGDLEHIIDWLAAHYPAIAPAVERRIRDVITHLARWPESARRSAKRPGVRVASIGRYPYKIFYRMTDEAVVILHIHHAAQAPWDELP
jgi:plasmid stabilization system protein ParE